MLLPSDYPVFFILIIFFKFVFFTVAAVLPSGHRGFPDMK